MSHYYTREREKGYEQSFHRRGKLCVEKTVGGIVGGRRKTSLIIERFVRPVARVFEHLVRPNFRPERRPASRSRSPPRETRWNTRAIRSRADGPSNWTVWPRSLCYITPYRRKLCRVMRRNVAKYCDPLRSFVINSDPSIQLLLTTPVSRGT